MTNQRDSESNTEAERFVERVAELVAPSNPELAIAPRLIAEPTEELLAALVRHEVEQAPG